MKLAFVHGWSVTNTETYGELPEAIDRFSPPDLNIEIEGQVFNLALLLYPLLFWGQASN